ncbi:hypothetical protein B0I27_10588 [Arcticibacter pallidicorallinus]|uniref:Uncharacterized protein n=1 Tax=Arcticibacter pallidicorallinus TaxID=1259464 RepID=A0A2T0U3X4_9SPHI|nr:hypothetical protein [Arcticibacter pallidicorallinus]PRY52622.1 hypothetical protein B0I27_10588 [Arcticibacter pallidicorallinus]
MPKNYQDFKKLLFHPKINKKQLFEELKVKYSFEEQESVLKQLPKIFTPFVTGNSLMKDKAALGLAVRNSDYSFKISLNWYCQQIKLNQIEVNEFLRLREDYEQQFLLGKYSESNKTLLKVSNSISHSLWSIENEFLQVQFEKGLEHNFKLLNASQAINVKDRSFYFLLHFFSVKVEEDISYFNYETSLNSSFSSVPKQYVNFFNYRLNPMNYSFGNLEDLFTVYSNYSILDRYILVRDVLVQLCTDERSEEEKLLCLERSRFLSKFINDPVLLKIIALLGDEQDFTQLIEIKKCKIIDHYTQGRYIETIELSKNYLLEMPNDFSLLELYVKSHIHLNIELECISINPCFLDIISKLTYTYLSKIGDPNESLVDLLTQANAISNFDFSKEIVSFLERNMKIDYFKENSLSYFYSRSLNPLHYTVFKNEAKRASFLGCLDTETSLTFNFFRMLNGSIDKEKFKGIIPEYRINYYTAITHFVRGEFEIAKNGLEQILKESNHAGFFFELVVDCLFKCYVALFEIDCAIDLYVHTYLTNETLVSRIDSSKAIEVITSQRFRNVRHDNINLPVFIYNTASETHAKFIAYDLFMRAVKANRPTELFSILEKTEAAEMFFLRFVATSKIISRKALVFKNSLQVIEERIEICQGLSKIDTTNIEEYNNEISELTKRLTVQLRIKEIDQSMIYVDENGIVGHELGETNKGFNRFRSIAELLNLNKIDATGMSYDALLELLIGNIDRDTYKKSIRKADIHFEHFIQLFIQIRDKFLFSNYYGLDYYLSQRIRHGTIIGQLRRQFQELNLVTSRSSEDGDYLPNLYWSSTQLGLDKEVKEKFELRMSQFSQDIDAVITELKDRYIQIKTEDPKTQQSGWFNYMYIPNWHKDHLYSLFISKIQLITDFNEFTTSIFDILWDMTAQNLQRIRTAIDQQVKAILISHLDELESDLMIILKDSQPGKIMKSIADCRTNVQSDVDTVIRWFNRSKNDEIDFTLADAFNTSLTIVNNINSPFLIHFDENLETQTFFKGAYFTHFVDLLKIFITNIFNYSKANELLNVAAKVRFHLEGEILTIDFKNSLAELDSQEALLLKIDEIKTALLSNNYSATRGEVKSGFYKANNIVKNVFRDKSNEITVDLHANTFKVKIKISVNNLLV